MAGLWPVLMLLTAAPAGDRPVSFRKDVAPILASKCLGCHGGKTSEGGLSLATFAALKRGGKSGGASILEAGDPDGSGLIEAIRPGAEPRMPFKLPPLSTAEIATLERWVRQGAKFDGPSATETKLAALVDPLGNLPAVALKATVSDPVTALAFSADGKTLAAAVGRSVVLLDAESGKPLRTFADHPGPLTTVKFTPDGKSLVAAGGRAGMFGAVTVWDPGTGAKRGEGRCHADAVLAADVAPDGKTLATAGYDRLVVLWDLASVRPVRTLKDHTDAVSAVAFAPDGKTLASAGADRTVKLWNPADGRRIKTLSDSTGELHAVVFARDGSTVYAAGVDRSIRAWKVAGNETTLLGSVFAHDRGVLRLAIDGDGTTLYSAGEDRAVKLWDAATLAPKRAIGGLSDWPHGLAVRHDGRRLAVGLHDGSLVSFDPASGARLVTTRAVAAVSPPPRRLVRNATLNPPTPRGVARGATTRLTLTGHGAHLAREVVLFEPGCLATIVPVEKPVADRIDVDLVVSADARLGLHGIALVTPLGVPVSQTFAVEAVAATPEKEPNDDPAHGTEAPFPATFVGAIDRPGDVDHFRVKAEAGELLVFATTARALGSKLSADLSILDEPGKTLATAAVDEIGADPVVAFTATTSGVYVLRVTDVDYEGSGEHFYRVAAGRDAYLQDAFPVGVAPGRTAEVAVRGVGLRNQTRARWDVPAQAKPGSILAVPLQRPAVNRRLVVVAEGPQAVESEPNDEPARATRQDVPSGVSGRIDRDGDVDLVRFHASKGDRTIVEVFGRRLGAPIDPVVEVLDADARPIPRVVLRPITQTEVAFRDHDATGPGVRLTTWNNFAVNDLVVFGREVARILELPRNPDDDCQFWSERGQRVAFLETTPEHHPLGQPIYKVEVHAPGATFPAGGLAPVTLPYRNDDGGPPLGKDARLTFEAPADGDYLVRVFDARGLGSASFVYHLVLRRPHPDFELEVTPADPSVPRGGTALVAVRLKRIDGFNEAVEVRADGLPPGVSATPAVVEPGATTAVLALSADADAPTVTGPSWRVSARGHELDPGGPSGGRITVTSGPNLRVTASPDHVSLQPGGQVSLTLAVDRGPAFKGRVPIDVRNLPHGVRVLDVGLNGVLVTESQTERTVRIYAEPWVEPGARDFYAVGRAESAGTDDSSPPIRLVVAPPATASTSPATPRQ